MSVFTYFVCLLFVSFSYALPHLGRSQAKLKEKAYGRIRWLGLGTVAQYDVGQRLSHTIVWNDRYSSSLQLIYSVADAETNGAKFIANLDCTFGRPVHYTSEGNSKQNIDCIWGDQIKHTGNYVFIVRTPFKVYGILRQSVLIRVPPRQPAPTQSQEFALSLDDARNVATWWLPENMETMKPYDSVTVYFNWIPSDKFSRIPDLNQLQLSIVDARTLGKLYSQGLDFEAKSLVDYENDEYEVTFVLPALIESNYEYVLMLRSNLHTISVSKSFVISFSVQQTEGTMRFPIHMLQEVYDFAVEKVEKEPELTREVVTEISADVKQLSKKLLELLPENVEEESEEEQGKELNEEVKVPDMMTFDEEEHNDALDGFHETSQIEAAKETQQPEYDTNYMQRQWNPSLTGQSGYYYPENVHPAYSGYTGALVPYGNPFTDPIAPTYPNYVQTVPFTPYYQKNIQQEEKKPFRIENDPLDQIYPLAQSELLERRGPSLFDLKKQQQ